MASRGKELTTQQKEIILNLSNEGFSSYKIQNMKASTVEQSRSFWSVLEKEETLKTEMAKWCLCENRAVLECNTIFWG